MAKTTNASDKVIIRLPDGMRDNLKEIAAVNNRTMNAEIVERLTSSLQWPFISISPERYTEAMALPVDILSDLEHSFKIYIETLIKDAFYKHRVSQDNLVSEFEFLLDCVPEDERPRLKREIRELFGRAGVNIDHFSAFQDKK